MGSPAHAGIGREFAALRQSLDQREEHDFDLESYVDDRLQSSAPTQPPVTLQDIERTLVSSERFGARFRRHEQITGAYHLEWRGRDEVLTFDVDTFDRHPNSVQLLTYGHPLLIEMLEEGSASVESEDLGPVVLARRENGAPVSLCLTGSPPRRITRFAELEQVLGKPATAQLKAPSPADVDALVTEESAQRGHAETSVIDERRRGERLEIKERARDILREAAALERVKASRTQDLFAGRTVAPALGVQPIRQLADEGVPWRGLYHRVLDREDLELKPDDPMLDKLGGLQEKQLDRRLRELHENGRALLQRFRAIEEPKTTEQADPGAARFMIWSLGFFERDLDSRQRADVGSDSLRNRDGEGPSRTGSA